jgi:hypothetical protein
MAADQPGDDGAAETRKPSRPRFTARLLFALIGAAGCLLAALALEGLFGLAHTRQWLDDHETPVLLFVHHRHGEMERRLREANAQSGDVEITLTWNNLNDLDLHCLAPTGEWINFERKVSEKSGGRLDVDRNMAPPYTQQPVEHIYWPHGRAPAGRYGVYVNHYSRHGSVDPTHYQVTVKEYGHVYRYSGQISRGDPHPAGTPGKFVAEFTAGRPAFELFGLPASFWVALLVIAAWAAALATALRFTLLGGLHLFYRRVYRERLQPPPKAARTAIACALWAAFGGALAQTAYALLPELPSALSQQPSDFLKFHPTWAHVAGLAVLAAILGMAVGGRVPHLKRGWAFLGGLAGGALAGRLFTAVYFGNSHNPVDLFGHVLRFGESVGSEIGGRLAAATIIGALIGFMIALIVEVQEPPEEPVVYADDVLDSMQPLSLRANRIGPTGKLRRAGHEPANR